MTGSSNQTGTPTQAPVYAWVSDVAPAPIALRIRDVSPTGLLLSFDGLPPEIERAWFVAGATVGLALPVMTQGGLVSVAAGAQIKGVFPAGLAVKLTQPDERLLAAVRHLLIHGAQSPPRPAAGTVPEPAPTAATAPRSAQAVPPAPGPRARPARPALTRDAAFADCRQVLQHHLATLVSGFQHRLAAVLLAAISNAPQPAAKRQLEALRASFQQVAAATGSRIEQNLRGCLEARLALAAAGSSLPAIELPAELTLVQTRELRDSIAWSDSVARIQTQLRSRSYEVERRFADLLRHEADPDSDPMAVPQLCIALRDAMIAEVPAAESHQRHLAEALEGEVAGRIGALYDDLNEVLKKHGTQAKPAPGRSHS